MKFLDLQYVNQAFHILEEKTMEELGLEMLEVYYQLDGMRGKAKELKDPMLVGLCVEDEIYNNVMKLIVDRMSINA
jgi:hypothetical protein